VQDGPRLSGGHLLALATAELCGTIDGTRAIIWSTHSWEGNAVRFTFCTERAERNALEGLVVMGASAPHTVGPVAFGQFGEATWRGERLR